MTPEEHKKTHEELHASLDQLVADWITHNPGKFPSRSTIMELIEWSHQQTLHPEEKK